MDTSASEVIELVSKAFANAAGPATFRHPESGWWYEWEGKEIAKVLLNLDPSDLEYNDIILPGDGVFLPAWATNEGLMWLTPAVIRVCFEVDPRSAAPMFQRLFTELYDRVKTGEITLTPPQKRSLLNAHEVFYCTEEFEWNPDKHTHPLCELLKQPDQGLT